MELQKTLSLAEEAAYEAGRFLKSNNERQVVLDTKKDVKLREDFIAEEKAIKILAPTGYDIVSEEVYDESGRHFSGKGLNWIIDCLDGTSNYLAKINYCAVSVGLWKDLEPIAGVIYDFNNDDIYSGIVGRRASLNGNIMNVNSDNDEKRTLIVTGSTTLQNLLGQGPSSLTDFFKDKKIRTMGSCALSLAHIASGKMHAYYEDSIKIWDVAAGLALIKAAGGDFSIKHLEGNKYRVFASNGKIKNENYL